MSTHTKVFMDISLATHLTGLGVGDILKITEGMRGLDVTRWKRSATSSRTTALTNC